HAVEALGDLEEPREHAVGLEVRAERLLVEVVEREALLLGPVAHVPGLHRARGLALDLLAERLELLLLALERGAGLVLELGDEARRVGAGLRHAVLEHEVGEVAVAEQLRLLAPQLEDAQQVAAVVVASTVELARARAGV